MITFICIVYGLPLLVALLVTCFSVTLDEIPLKIVLNALLFSVIPVVNILFLLIFFVGIYGLYTGKVTYNEETKELKILKKKGGD